MSDDFEESNAIDDYLAKLESNLENDENNESVLNDIERPTILNNNALTSTNKKSTIGSFLGLSDVIDFIPKTNIMYDSDIQIILESHLKTKNFLFNSFSFTDCLKQNKNHLKWLLLVLLALMIVSPLLAALLIFSSLFSILLVKKTLGINKLIQSRTIQLAESYLKKLNTILCYLKEVELLSLSTRRRLLIETNSTNLETHDPLNFQFRQIVFNKLREHFFQIKKINRKIFSDFNSKNELEIDSDFLICEINESELAEVLLSEDEAARRKLSDDFNLNCIKSIKKLIQLLISENLKILKLNELNLLFESISLKTIISLTRLILNNFHNKSLFSKLFNDLNYLNNYVNLIESLDGMKEGEKRVVKTDDPKHLLNVHLRNAYLISLELRKEEKEEESLKMLKYNFEFCELYMKRLLNELDAGFGNGRVGDGKLESPVDLDALNDAIKNMDEVKVNDEDENFNEDEIFEADTTKLAVESEVDNLNNEETSLKKETYLIGKNLICELKFALKEKRVEWKRREKRARKKIDGKIVPETYNNNDEFDDLDDSEEYLLENNALKYKSEIRKRRSNKGSKTKLEQDEEETVNSISDQNKRLQSTGATNLLLKEFMLKRNHFFTKQDNDDEDETILE